MSSQTQGHMDAQADGQQPEYGSSPQNSNIPEDLSLQLRNVGARVRRSVAQGYMTPPSSHSFARHQTTGTIFRSANDTLRDVFTNQTSAATNTHSIPKRNRSTLDDETNNNDDLDSKHTDGTAMDLEGVKLAESRPIKPLRSYRKTVSDSALTFGVTSQSRPPAMAPTIEAEEEDWSMMESDGNSTASPFKPLAL